MNCPPIRLTFGLCCLMLVAGAGVAGAQQAQARERLLVVPFENLQREGKYYWVSEAAATLLTSNLEALGVGAISREQRLKAFEQLQLPPVAPLAEATMIRLGQMIGAAQVVMGSFAVEDGQLTVKARAIRLDTGRMRPPAAETGPLSDFFAVFDRLSRQLLPPGLTAPERLDVDHGSLAVFENYVKGLVAVTTAARIRFLNGALELTPDFAPARIALWQVYTSQGDHARAATAALGVPMASRLYRRARFLIALSKIHLKQYDEAFQGLKALLDVSATPTLFNNLGVIQARRGGTPQTGRATYYFTKAAEADPQDPDYAFNLGYAYWLDKDPQAAAYWLKEAVRRNPADGDAHFVLGAVLHATNAPVEGEREKELARQLSSTYADWERRPNAASEPVPKGLERLRDDLDAPRLTLVDTALVPTEQKDQKDLAAFHADRGRRMFEQKQDVEAIQELKRSLYLLPYQADVHLLLGRIYLRTGRLAEATEALKISLWSQDSSAAHAALGEAYLEAKDVARARAELQKALQIDPSGAEAKQLAARLDASQR
jgi:tetratricopeptide (TPR) repeat protein/TolB-like protein